MVVVVVSVVVVVVAAAVVVGGVGVGVGVGTSVGRRDHAFGESLLLAGTTALRAVVEYLMSSST